MKLHYSFNKLFIFATFFISLQTFAQKDKFSIGGGTCILTFITNDSVIMASDTRHYLTYSDGRKPLIDTVHKIDSKNNIFYASAGLTEVYHNGIKIFDAQDVLKRTVSNKIEFTDMLTLFNHKLNNAIDEMIDKNYLKASYLFDSLPDRIMLDVAIINFDKNVPQYLFGIFKIEGKNKPYTKFSQSPLSKTEFIHKTGFHDHIDSFLNKNEKFKNSYSIDIKYKLIHLISIEAKEHPLQVACPIDMVIIKHNSHHWLKRVKTCHEIK